MGPGSAAGHELLVGLAGRLPDEVLWRLRDWLGAQAHAAVAAVLPRELLRHRLGLDEHERALLVEAVGGWGASPRLLDAVLPAHAPDEPAFRFTPDPSPADVTALSVLGVVRGYPGCTRLQLARRVDARGARRVVLVHGGDHPWVLAAMLQRVLRAGGDRVPCVEVLPTAVEPPAYHRAAIAASALLWRCAVSTDELVRS